MQLRVTISYMSKWGSRHQMTYIGVFLALLFTIIIIVIVRNVDTTPTCFDYKQNGDEEGIDCGGSCQLVCTASARSIAILWERPLPVTDTVYNAVAYFENQNVSAGSANLQYRFRLYDAKNVIVAERTGETFIGPNQRSAIFEGGINVGNRKPVNAFFEILQTPTWVATPTRWNTTSLVVQNRQLAERDGSPRLSADIQNITLNPISDIEVIAILYDASDNAIAASETLISRISAGSSTAVTFTWPQSFDRDVVRIEIIPRINIFSENNN